MTYQLVNILEYIIPEAVEAEIDRRHWGSQLDDAARQHIVLGVLNRIPPSYQLLTPDLLTSESRAQMPSDNAESVKSSSVGTLVGAVMLGDKTATPVSPHTADGSLAVTSMLSSQSLQQLQAAVATEIAEHVTSTLVSLN